MNVNTHLNCVWVMSIGVTDSDENYIQPLAPPPMAKANAKIIKWTGVHRDLYGLNAKHVEKEIRDATKTMAIEMLLTAIR